MTEYPGLCKASALCVALLLWPQFSLFLEPKNQISRQLIAVISTCVLTLNPSCTSFQAGEGIAGGQTWGRAWNEGTKVQRA